MQLQVVRISCFRMSYRLVERQENESECFGVARGEFVKVQIEADQAGPVKYKGKRRYKNIGDR